MGAVLPCLLPFHHKYLASPYCYRQTSSNKHNVTPWAGWWPYIGLEHTRVCVRALRHHLYRDMSTQIHTSKVLMRRRHMCIFTSLLSVAVLSSQTRDYRVNKAWDIYSVVSKHVPTPSLKCQVKVHLWSRRIANLFFFSKLLGNDFKNESNTVFYPLNINRVWGICFLHIRKFKLREDWLLAQVA